MNPKNTWLWITVAAVLFAFIFFFERHTHKPPGPPPKILAGFKAADVRSVQVLPRGQSPILAERTNDGWFLTGHYPAQAVRIENLLLVLERLAPAKYIADTPADVDQRFGFETPQTSLIIGNGSHHLLIGDKTAPGDQVFVQVVGVPGVFIVDANLLKLIPQGVVDWRETALVDWTRMPFDRLVVTNAGKILELQANTTNNHWQMIFPVHNRAADTKVEGALHGLAGLQAQQFVSDDPRPDLDSFGLQNPDVSLAFFQNTNRVLLLEFGKSPTNDASLAYARRADQNSVVTVPRDTFDPWLASHSDNFRDFMDRHLLALTRMPDSIEVRGQEETFTFSLTTNGWRILPQDFPADLVLLQDFVSSLVNLEFTEIAKENVPTQDLPDYGLAAPVRQIIMKSSGTNETDAATRQLDFGVHDGKVYARCGGESFVYAVKQGDLEGLPSAGWRMRDRRVWNFTQNNVARVAIRQGGKVRELIHKGTNSWSLAPGSQGSVDQFFNEGLEEAVFRLGKLDAAVWVQRGDQNREEFNFAEVNYQVTVEMNNGDKLTVAFGKEAPSHSRFASSTINGETWIFEFPWLMFHQYVQKYLAIPAEIP